MTAAKNATIDVRTRRFYKEIYVSALSMFSAMSKRSRPRPAVNELLVEEDKFTGKLLC